MNTVNHYIDLPVTGDSVSRSQLLAEIQRRGAFDILVVGGGIHGAIVARLAAASGFKTLLLEKADFAGATSSRSSKMAHGGLRYLELLDFEQVFEGIKARDEMFEHLSHLVKPSEFLIPVPKGKLLFKWKLGLGLFLYDLLLKHPEHRHRWIPRSQLSFPGFHSGRQDLMGCYRYTDGIMSDARIVIENVLAARRAGALCINHCEVIGRTRSPDETSTVSFRNSLTGATSEVRARLVINCAGPWCSALAHQLGSESSRLKFSRGSHIIFAKPWSGPSLFLPLEGRARYYFVWPHPAGTLVGTTEREVSELSDDPTPSRDEIEEIFARVERDIPDAGLRRENACYCFAGIRTLPLRNRVSHSAVLSRKHVWTHQDGVLSLAGGKYTTAWWTALEGLREAAQLLGRALEPATLRHRTDLKELPGSMTDGQLADITTKLSPLADGDRARLITRYGKRLLQSYWCLVDPDIEKQVALETEIALDTEQAESLEDLMRRRLELECIPGHGLHYLPTIRAVFQRLRPDLNFDAQAEAYRERMMRIDALLR